MMHLYPLELTFHVRDYAFGERLIPDMLGKTDTPEGIVAETWEVSDWREARASILNGEYAGEPFHDLVMAHPEEIVGSGWSGPDFPLLAKFLDASHPLPVHLHADDETALTVYGEPHGKTESWHILWAEPKATILAGIKPGFSDDDLFDAFKRQDYDMVMYRYPISSGDTVYVPSGILHAFGPNTLIFEIQQTSDLTRSVMPTDIHGNRLAEDDWNAAIRGTLSELRNHYLPVPQPGLTRVSGRNAYRTGSAGPHFALERWLLREPHQEPDHPDRCFTVSNVGGPATIRWEKGEYVLERAKSCVIPAALGPFNVTPIGQADLIVCYLPDLERDVITPLRNAGFGHGEISALGEIDID